jgi:acetyl esterase
MVSDAKGSGGPAIARLIDAEIAAFVARTESFYPASTNRASAAENRATYDRMCAAFRAPRPEGVLVEDEYFAAEEPARRLAFRRCVPRAGRGDATLLYLHGGGGVVGGLDSHDDVCAELSLAAQIEVVSLDYRLAPEHRYPAALDDAEAAYRLLLAEGRRVVVGGDSGGGKLAAALCLRMNRLARQLPMGQLLIYPGLGGDPRRVAATRQDVPLLSVRDIIHYRSVSAGGVERVPQDDPEFAPLAAQELQGLPPAAIFAAGIDPLALDAEDYAALLLAAGVRVRYRLAPGLVHGWLRARHMSRTAAETFADIAAALRELAAL